MQVVNKSADYAGDLAVWGKATDGSVDHDRQIVDPAWSAAAIREWLATGGNIRLGHDPRRPVGKGVKAETDASGATWVRSLVVESEAKNLVSKGVLTAYSVGIAYPQLERDLTGKAAGGIIKGGKVVEISLVDRPANANCGIQLVKSVAGVPTYTGTMFGTVYKVTKSGKFKLITKAADRAPAQPAPRTQPAPASPFGDQAAYLGWLLNSADPYEREFALSRLAA